MEKETRIHLHHGMVAQDDPSSCSDELHSGTCPFVQWKQIKRTMDYYAILGIEESATQDEIRRAYRRAARVSHPDYSRETDASRFREIQQAYEVLADPETRERYDRNRQHTIEVPVHIDARGRQRPRTQVREIYPSGIGTAREHRLQSWSRRDSFEDLLHFMLRLF